MEARRVEVLLAQHVVQVHAGAGHHHARARAVGAGHGGAAAVAVHHRHVGGGAQPRADLAGHVVQRRAAQEALREVLLGQPLQELLVARPVGGGDHLGQRPVSPGRSIRSSSSSASAIRMPPEEGGGLVSTRRPRKDASVGRALPHPVGGQVRAGEQPAALQHPIADRRGHVALVEESRALLRPGGPAGRPARAWAVARPRRAGRPCGLEQGPALLGGAEDRAQDPQQVLLDLGDLHPLARGGRRGSRSGRTGAWCRSARSTSARPAGLP